VDYWDIHIANVITSLSYDTILNSCVDFANGPNQIYCQLVHRNVDGTVNYIEAQYANLAAEHARGIDIGANYRAPMGKGLFRLGFSGTYLLEQKTIAQLGQPGIDYAGQWDYPRFKATLTASYSIGKITFGVNTRFTSRSLYSATAASLETYEYPYVPSYICNDLTVRIRPTETYSLTLGVKNIGNAAIFAPLQDTAAGPHGSGGTQTGAAYYDPVGRSFFLKIDVSL
jgi:outer membrane receptor protein involved in Fe transport